MRTILLFLCLGQLLPAFAQTPEADLRKVLELLTGSEQLYYENLFYYYESGETKPSDTLNGTFHRNGKQEYVQMGQTEVLDTGTRTVIVDHDERIVAVRQSTQTLPLDKMIDAEQMLGLVETRQLEVRYSDTKSPGLTLIVTDKQRPGETMEIRFDPMTTIVQQIKITGSDPFVDPLVEKAGQVTIEVRYVNVTTAPRPFGHTLGQYVVQKGDKYVPIGKCKGYTLM